MAAMFNDQQQQEQQNQIQPYGVSFGTRANGRNYTICAVSYGRTSSDQLPVETLEERYRKLEFRLGEIQRLGTRPIRDKITSSGLDSIQFTPIPFDSTHSHPMQSDLIESNPASSNPI